MKKINYIAATFVGGSLLLGSVCASDTTPTSAREGAETHAPSSTISQAKAQELARIDALLEGRKVEELDKLPDYSTDPDIELRARAIYFLIEHGYVSGSPVAIIKDLIADKMLDPSKGEDGSNVVADNHIYAPSVLPPPSSRFGSSSFPSVRPQRQSVLGELYLIFTQLIEDPTTETILHSDIVPTWSLFYQFACYSMLIHRLTQVGHAQNEGFLKLLASKLLLDDTSTVKIGKLPAFCPRSLIKKETRPQISYIELLSPAIRESVLSSLLLLGRASKDNERIIERIKKTFRNIVHERLKEGENIGELIYEVKDDFFDNRMNPNLLADVLIFLWANINRIQISGSNFTKFIDFLAMPSLTLDRRIELACHEVIFNKEGLNSAAWLKFPGLERLGYWHDGIFSPAFQGLPERERVRVLAAIFTAIGYFREHNDAHYGDLSYPQEEILKQHMTSLLIGAGYWTSDTANRYWAGGKKGDYIEENLIFVLVDSLFERGEYELICDMLQKWTYNCGVEDKLTDINTHILNFPEDILKKFKKSLQKSGRLDEFLRGKQKLLNFDFGERQDFKDLDISEE